MLKNLGIDQKILQFVIRTSTDMAEEGEGVPFTMISLTKKGVIIATPVSDIPMESMFEIVARPILQHIQAIWCIIVVEMWYVEGKESRSRVDSGVSITDLPLDDRKNMLLIGICKKSGESRFIAAEIYNTPQGKKVQRWEEWKNVAHLDNLVLKGW